MCLLCANWWYFFSFPNTSHSRPLLWFINVNSCNCTAPCGSDDIPILQLRKESHWCLMPLLSTQAEKQRLVWGKVQGDELLRLPHLPFCPERAGWPGEAAGEPRFQWFPKSCMPRGSVKNPWFVLQALKVWAPCIRFLNTAWVPVVEAEVEVVCCLGAVLWAAEEVRSFCHGVKKDPAFGGAELPAADVDLRQPWCLGPGSQIFRAA